MRGLIVAILCSFVPIVASAGSSSPGKVLAVVVTKDGIIKFYSTGERFDRPSCATDDGYTIGGIEIPFRMATDAMLSTLLSAQASGKSVVVLGTGQCAYGGEIVDAFYTLDVPPP